MNSTGRRRIGPAVGWGAVLGVWLGAGTCLMAMHSGGTRLILIDGRPFVSVTSLARTYGLVLRDDGLTLDGADSSIRFCAESRKAWHNGDLVWLQQPVRKARRGWAISESDWRTYVDPMIQPLPHLPRKPVRVVVLDPGHGGTDLGTQGAHSTQEKFLALDLCERVKKCLEDQGVLVLLTRSSDVAMDLEARADFAARNQADLFVSVHFNSAGNPEAKGIETFILPSSTEASTSDWGKPPVKHAAHRGNAFDGANAVLGQAIHHHLLQSTRAEDRGLRRARFMVLKEARCPAALVECGFLSHSDEELRIQSPAYRDALANGIAGGVLGYVESVRENANVAASLKQK